MNANKRELLLEENDASLPRSSVFALVSANCIPLLSVLFGGWSVFDVVFLFWLENVVIGFWNVPKILMASGSLPVPAHLLHIHNAPENQLQQRIVSVLSRVFLVPFFMIHYGGFTLVHGIFVFMLLGGGLGSQTPLGLAQSVGQVLHWGLLAGFAALMASHGYSFFSNYIGRREYERVAPFQMLFAPYPRIVVIHIAILAGGFAIAILNAPRVMLVLLIAGKIALDAILHRREHAAASKARPAPAGTRS